MVRIGFLFVVCAVTAALPFQAHISKNNGSKVDFSLTNTDENVLTVCVWGTPLETSITPRADMFNVTQSGVSAVYIGIVVKRIPTESDFITLQLGETATISVDLLEGYRFPSQGKYSVTLQSYIYVKRGSQVDTSSLDSFTLYDLTSPDTVSIHISSSQVNLGSNISHGASTTLDVNDGTVTTLNCNTTRSAAIQTAAANAITLVQGVLNYLNALDCANASVYIKWMGLCDPTRYAKIKTDYTNILNRYQSGFSVNCAGSQCQANTYAYVFKADTTFTINVCGAFWSASAGLCITDSKPGTLVHEMSHFTSTANTDDIQYGSSGCLRLALNSPAQAVNNADSHEYLAEACPVAPVIPISKLSVTSNLPTAELTEPLTWTVTLASTAGTPTGTVTFQEGANILGSITVTSSGQGPFSPQGLPVGSHTITAVYAGNSPFPSVSFTFLQTVIVIYPIFAQYTTPTQSTLAGQIITATYSTSPTLNLTAGGLISAPAYTYAPRRGVKPNTVTLAASSNVTLTVNAPISIPVLLYARKWPVGIYTFGQNLILRSQSTGTSLLGTTQIQVRRQFSGIIEFTPNVNVISWRSTANAAQSLSYTLATRGGSHV